MIHIMKGKNKINKYLTSKSKNVYIDKSADPVNEYNITYCTTTKMNPIDGNFSPYIDFDVENIHKDPDHLRISKYKNSSEKI